MPPVVVAVVAGAAAYAAGVTVVTAITLAVAAAALYSVATMDMPSTPGTDPSSAKQTIRTPNQPCRGVFGTAMLGGPLIFAEEYLNESGYDEEYVSCGYNSHVGKQEDREYSCNKRTRHIDTSTKYLHLVIVLANHPCDAVPEVYFGDDKQEDWDHEFWKINVMTGNQKVIGDLPKLLTDVPSWTDTMIGEGLTYVHIALKHSAKHFPNGIPGIKCLVKGMSLKTPFFNGFGTNAAACIYHYLRYEFGATEKMINTASFANEFQICGELMPAETPDKPAPDPDNPDAVIPDPVTPMRYEINGAYDYDETHSNVLKKMLSACGGNLIFTNGQYHLQVAAYRGPLIAKQRISLSDLNGPVNIIPETSLSDRVNTVRGQYLDPTNGYLQVDFSPVTKAEYVAEDGGEERVYDADLEFVINKHQAHRLANIILKDNRFGLTISAPMNLSGFKFNAGLLVGFDEKTLGYDGLEFRVATWKLSPKGGVELSLKQTAPEIYDDSTAPVVTKPTESQLPDPKFCYPVANLTFDTLEDDGVYDGMLWWSHPDLQNIREFEIVSTSTGGEIFRTRVGKDTEYRLQNMRGVEYKIVVIAYNRYGAPSSPVSITTKVGAPKPIQSVVFEPDNFEVTIRPLVSGELPQNSRFSFFRANSKVPASNNMTKIGEGVTFTDSGLTPNTAYNYYIQPINGSAAGSLFGPYATKTTDNPDDIYDFIKDEIPGQYTWTVYATDAFGSGLSLTYNAAIHNYEGRAYNKLSETPSRNPLDYTFFRIGEFITDKEQDVLDNLANGKTPDGTEDLVGAVAVKTIAAQEVTALKVLADWVTTKNLAAGAVSADKIAVTVVSPVHNYSEFGDLRGWKVPSGINLVDEISLNGAKAKTLKVQSGGSNRDIPSDKFSIDPNSIYEVRFSIYCGQSTGNVKQELALRAYDSSKRTLSCKNYHPITRKYVSATTAPVLWTGAVTNGWRHMIGYIVGANADVEACAKALNTSHIIKLPANTRGVVLLTKVVSSSTVLDTHFYSPSVIKVGSGLIVADEIRANSKISSPIIDGGEINGTEVNGVVVNGSKFYGGLMYGGKLITGSSGMLTPSEYNQERYGTMDVKTIIEGGNKPYLAALTFPDSKDSNYDLFGGSGAGTINPPVAIGGSQRVTGVKRVLDIRPYNDPDVNEVNRFARKDYGVEVEVLIEMTVKDTDIVVQDHEYVFNNPKYELNIAADVRMGGGVNVVLATFVKDSINHISDTYTTQHYKSNRAGWSKLSIRYKARLREYTAEGIQCTLTVYNRTVSGQPSTKIDSYIYTKGTARLTSLTQNFS